VQDFHHIDRKSQSFQMLSSFLQPQCSEISDQETKETLQVCRPGERVCVFHLFFVFLICPFKLNSWAHFLLWKCSRCLEFQWCFLCIDYSSENQHFVESIFIKKTEGSIQEVNKFKKSTKYRHMSTLEVLSMWHCKNISHVQISLLTFFQPYP